MLTHLHHRRIPLRYSQTHGMVKRCNGRLAEGLQTHHFDATIDLATPLWRYVDRDNHHLPPRTLSHQAPVQALQRWPSTPPDAFRKQVYHLTGLDN